MSADFRAQTAALRAFDNACREARRLLPPLHEFNESQRHLVLGAAVEGLNSAQPPEYGRAMKLLCGEFDSTRDVPGGWRLKQHRRGRMRLPLPARIVVVPVRAT